MKSDEFVKFIDMAQSLTGRGFDDHDAYAWRVVIGDLPYTLAVEAIEQQVRSADTFVTASTVRQAAMRVARDRLERDGESALPPSGLNPEEYLQWTRARRKAVIDGANTADATRAALGALGREPEPATLANHPVPHVSLRDGSRTIIEQ